MTGLLCRTKTRLYASFLLFASTLFLLAGCTERQELVRFAGNTMGTTYHISIASDRDIAVKALKEQVDQLLLSINYSMSTYIEDSELNRFNRSQAGENFEVSAGLCAVLEQANNAYQLSGGAFDPTVGPLVDLWGFGSAAASGVDTGVISNQIPDREAITEVLKIVGFRHLDINCSQRTLVKREEVQVDLSAIAKGYGVDRVVALLRTEGFRHFLVEIGGEVFVSGTKLKDNGQAGKSWKIAIEKPVYGLSLSEPQVEEVLQLSDIGMATSGDYRNYFEQDGVRYSHTINPLDGYPVRHHLVSVTVLHESVAMADALATALMVMEPEQGVSLAGQEDIAAYFIVKQGEAFTSRTTAAFERLTKLGNEL